MAHPPDLERYLKDCVAIEPLALTEEFVRLPADLAYWSEQHASAYRYALERELYRKTLEGKLYSEHQLRLAAGRIGAGRGPTVDEVKSAIAQDPSYIAARAEENEADSARVRLLGVVEAIRAKREMIVSLGAHLRAEMQHDPLLRTQQYKDSQLEQARAWSEAERWGKHGAE